MIQIYLAAICAATITIFLLAIIFIKFIKYFKNPEENAKPPFWNYVGLSLITGAAVFIAGQFIGWVIYLLTALIILRCIGAIVKEARKK
jgi:tellurite resistance protein TehA-like permease